MQITDSKRTLVDLPNEVESRLNEDLTFHAEFHLLSQI